VTVGVTVEGLMLGDKVGERVGLLVGTSVDEVGIAVSVGVTVEGLMLGDKVGESVGLFVGTSVDKIGIAVTVGAAVEGLMLGDKVGESVGLFVGTSVDEVVGLTLGLFDGRSVWFPFTTNDNETDPLFFSLVSFPGAPVANAFDFTATLRPKSISPADLRAKLDCSIVPLKTHSLSSFS
jgi:hypothetical protein